MWHRGPLMSTCYHFNQLIVGKKIGKILDVPKPSSRYILKQYLELYLKNSQRKMALTKNTPPSFRLNEDYSLKSGPDVILRILVHIIPQNYKNVKLAVPQISCYRQTDRRSEGRASLKHKVSQNCVDQL